MASKDMTPGQFNRLLDATNNPRDKLIFRLLAGTGLRSGELTTLKVKNLDLEEGIIVLENYNTKSHKSRKVVIPASLISDLKSWTANLEPEDYLFPGSSIKSGKIQPITTARLRQIFYNVASKAGFQRSKGKNKDHKNKNDFSLHSLRHYHAVQSLGAGVPINSVQFQLGHSSLKTTSIYLKKSVEERRRDYDNFEI